jgi:hypothetical protein
MSRSSDLGRRTATPAKLRLQRRSGVISAFRVTSRLLEDADLVFLVGFQAAEELAKTALAWDEVIRVFPLLLHVLG